jgi:hypothetical protein
LNKLNQSNQYNLCSTPDTFIQKKGSAISGAAFLGLYQIWIRMPANPAGTRF